MEELLFMILRGIVIGVVVSAPMGPVGIFCLQRTLDKGRESGFYTGIGAAISDLIYCLLTGFGLSFIEEFINSHRSPIQLLGSLVLVGFGIWLIRKQPEARVPVDADHDSSSPKGDILKGFALTFSNPLILFLIIGLFAQFNFVIEGMKFYHYILGFIGIIAGALGWWWVLTYFVDKLRSHFNLRTMKLINTGLGVAILIFAAVGIVSSASSLLSAAERQAPQLSDGNASMVMTFRTSDSGMKGWKIAARDSEDSGFNINVSHASRSDAFGDTKTDHLKLSVTDSQTDSLIAESMIPEGVDPYKGKNAWKIVREGYEWMVFAGNREYRHALSFVMDTGSPVSVTIEANNGGNVIVTDFYLEQASDTGLGYVDTESLDCILHAKKASRTPQGLYSLFDHEYDSKFASLGGNYRIAVVASADESAFDIIYLEGAVSNSAMWRKGKIKGKLMPTPFRNVYNVCWVDAAGTVMNKDVQADFDPLADTLSIKFPFQNSVLRFRKEQ